jgi:hypothetical protein
VVERVADGVAEEQRSLISHRVAPRSD